MPLNDNLRAEADTGQSAAAAEQVHQPAEAQAGAGVIAHGKAPEIACLGPVGGAAMLDAVQCVQVFIVVRLHGNRLADMLQGRDLIAQTVVGQGGIVVPPGAPVGHIVQHIQGLLEFAEADILPDTLEILVLLVGLLVLTAEGVIAAIAVAAVVRLLLLGILDLLVGRVDLLHFPGGLLVPGI